MKMLYLIPLVVSLRVFHGTQVDVASAATATGSG